MAEVASVEKKARAVAKYARVSSRKARKVVDLVRGKNVDEALSILRFSPQGAAKMVSKVLSSAVANAESNFRLNREDLIVGEAHVNQGPTLKRFRHRAMGRASRIRKRTSHITVVVQERGGK